MRKAFGIALVVGLVSWIPVAAGDVERFKGTTVSTFFWGVDEQGIETAYFVAAGESYEKTTSGKGIEGVGLYFWMYQYDGEIGQYILEGFEQRDLARGELVIDPQLKFASLKTTVTVYDRGEPMTLTIDLEFAGIGELERRMENRHFHFPDGGVSRLRFQGLQREAEITGSITGPGGFSVPLPEFGSLGDSNSFELNYEN